MKKKFLCLCLLLVLIISTVASTAVANAESEIRLIVGGESVKTDVAPVLINNRTMLPFRAVFEAIGAKVKYDDATKTVTSTKNGHTIQLTIDSDVMLVDGSEVKLDVPVFIKDNRTFVPLRACAEAFDMTVEWIDKSKIVRIKTEVSVPVETDNGNGYLSKHTYDDFGNCIYVESSDGSWSKYEYNEFGSIISFESSIGYWYKHTYNEQGILIATEGDGDDWQDVTYDENGNVIYATNGYNYTKYEYDEFDRLIYLESEDFGDFYWEKNTYDNNGNCTYTESSSGWIKYTYNENGDCILEESSDGSWSKYTYDENGCLLEVEMPGGVVQKYTYDDNGNCIYLEMPQQNLWWAYSYDENGNLIEERDSLGGYTKYMVVVK